MKTVLTVLALLTSINSFANGKNIKLRCTDQTVEKCETSVTQELKRLKCKLIEDYTRCIQTDYGYNTCNVVSTNCSHGFFGLAGGIECDGKIKVKLKMFGSITRTSTSGIFFQTYYRTLCREKSL